MLQQGQVVWSAAGHDKDGYYVVVAVEADGSCRIADGRRRKLAEPKRKNPKHLRPTRSVLELSEIRSDKALRRALAALRPEENAEE